MKITYRFPRLKLRQNCVAEAIYDNLEFTGYGDTWEEAKKELLQNIENYKINKSLIPEPEEVEI